MTTPSGFQPAGWRTVTPRIIVPGAEKLVEFVKDVFGATGQYQALAPAELRLGDSIIMISDAGALSIESPLDTPYGERRAMIQDAWGNTWQIATRRQQRTP